MKKLILFLLFLSLFLSTNVYSQQNNNFDELCGALIFNITRYVEWEKTEGDFEIVLVNQPKIGEILKKYFSSRKINGSNVLIINDHGHRTDFSNVEILISHKTVVQKNLLTIDINKLNGIINFIQENNKIKIKIRKSLIEKSDLKFSSSLTSMVEMIE